MMLNLNIFNLECQPTDLLDEPLDINTIQDLSSEHSYDECCDELDSLVDKTLFSMSSMNHLTMPMISGGGGADWCRSA